MATPKTTSSSTKPSSRRGKVAAAAAKAASPAVHRTRRVSTDVPKGNGSVQFENLMAKAAIATASAEASALNRDSEQASSFLGVAAAYTSLAQLSHFAKS